MSKTQAEKAYMSIAAGLHCSCCGTSSDVELHHPRVDQGSSQRAGNFCVIPLCRDCHGQDLGSRGLHGDKTYLRIYKKTEMSMLNHTIGEVFKKVARL